MDKLELSKKKPLLIQFHLSLTLDYVKSKRKKERKKCLSVFFFFLKKRKKKKLQYYKFLLNLDKSKFYLQKILIERYQHKIKMDFHNTRDNPKP